MKKIVWRLLTVLMVLSLVVVPLLLTAQDIHDTNQATVEWDPVDKIHPDDLIAYQVFRAPYPYTGDRQDVNAVEDLGGTTNTQMTITFTVEGEYIIGVRTVRAVQGTEVIKYSDLIWSDIDGDPPFVIRYYETPDSPPAIRYL